MKITKMLCAVLGLFFMVLGAIGVFFPVLPTTPFLLLAAFFFARSSERLKLWFESTELYKKHLAEFMANRSMTITTKRYILTLATVMISISCVLVDVLFLRIMLVAMLIIAHVYFKTQIRTIPEPEVCQDCA